MPKTKRLPFFAPKGDVRLPLLIAYMVAVFLFGGGSRADVSSLVILRPIAVLVCAVALLTLRMEDVRANRFLFGMAGAIFALVLIHLVPLPPALWSALPGRELVAEVDAVAGLGGVWRPIALVPEAGWNAFYALFVPLAALLLGVQLSKEQRHSLLIIVLGFALVSGLLGLLQSISSNRGILYLYRTTNSGASVGLFANRNHQAMMLAIAFPLLAVYASFGVRTVEQANMRAWIAVAAGMVLVPLILVAGSRAGLILGVVGLLFAILLYRRPPITIPKKRTTRRIDWRYPFVAFAVLCLGAITVIMSRAEALQRLLASDQLEDLRFQTFGTISAMTVKYFPLGSGVGSYVEVFQVDEPYRLLTFGYSNHAHNDWLEVALTTGLPGLVLLGIAVLAFGRLALRAWRQRALTTPALQFERLGCVVIGVLGLGSIVDYPLRTPTLACIFVVAVLWCAKETTSEKAGIVKRG